MTRTSVACGRFRRRVSDSTVPSCGPAVNEGVGGPRAARRYYEKVPKDLGNAVVFLLDPMLATGGSAAMAVDGLRGLGARQVRLLSIVAAPEGVAHLESVVPEAIVYTAALDRALNDRKYIVPGLGDFGDRLFGT